MINSALILVEGYPMPLTLNGFKALPYGGAHG